MGNIKDFSDMIPAKQVLFIIDSCFSGIVGAIHKKKDSKLSPETEKEIDAFVNSEGRQVMTAGKSDEPAEMGDRWNNHSVYTYYLLKGLRGEADFIKDGVIWIEELQLYLRKKVGEATGYKQTPQIFNLTNSEGQFVFYREGDK